MFSLSFSPFSKVKIFRVSHTAAYKSLFSKRTNQFEKKQSLEINEILFKTELSLFLRKEKSKFEGAKIEFESGRLSRFVSRASKRRGIKDDCARPFSRKRAHALERAQEFTSSGK